MADEIAYMLGVIGVGFLVNYTLRALPFILFSGRDRALPSWVEKLGGVISPVIIAALIVYAYSGSAWRTPWPYLAGVVTVGLQVWKRNPLLSIVTGTILYMVLLNCCGCKTQTVREIDATNPELVIRADGVYMGTKKLNSNKILDELQSAGISQTQAIHIRVEGNLKNLRAPSALMALLSKGGYTRSVLVTQQHDEFATKSGDDYKGSERMQRRADVFFSVTHHGGVRIGLLTPINPDKVLPYLRANGVETNQLIRLCGKTDEMAMEDVLEAMKNLRVILAYGGYTRVQRCWVGDEKAFRESTRQGKSSRQKERSSKTAIRWKSSGDGEDY